MNKETSVPSPLSYSKDRMYWMEGDIVIFKTTSEDTDGKYAICELVVPPDSETPPPCP